MPNWTISQQNAIEARNSNILVSAAAGSGKTAVLVERVIRLITDVNLNVDVDKLLIVTFTNAAAAEMKSRIAKALLKIIKADPNDTNAHRQLALLPNARVSTIDSFCIGLVRENFFNLDIEQDFKILDNSENAVLEQTAMDEVLDFLYENDGDDFKTLVDMFSSTKDDKGFAEVVNRISHFISSQAFPEKWLDEVCEAYNPDVKFEDSFWSKYVVDEVNSLLTVVDDLFKQSKDVLNVADDKHKKLLDVLGSDRLLIDNLIENAKTDKWDEMLDVINNISFCRFPSVKCDEKDFVKSNRDLYKDIITKSIAPMYSATSDDYLNDCEVLYPVIKHLTSVVKMYNQKLFEMKKEINSFTFSDIEHFAINLLFYPDEFGKIFRTPLADELEDSFYEILVDEYQDTNSAQDKLFEILSNGKNRFMVGDVKQSIYKFRLAMPFIFTNKKDRYAHYENGSEETCQKIILSNNFRSRKGVCDYVNFVCSNVMSKKVGGIDYNNEEMLNSSADFNESDVPSAQIKYISTPDDEDSIEYEAHQIANLILKKIASKEKIKDGDTYRNICYGDFAILLRSAKTKINAVTNVLSQYGIPTVANNKVNLFDNNEIVILLNFLRVIDNPTQDIPLLATLMSVFYGYTADDISQARVDCPYGNLFSAVSKSDVFSRFVDDLKKYREYASSMSVENLVRQIIGDTSYLSVISAMGNHEQRVQNVMLLVDIAKRFDNGENVGLTAFIRYVDSIIENKFNVESASVNEAGKDAVAVMTVHRSKGLEFPVCILAGASGKYNKDDITKGIIQLNPQKGIGLKVYDDKRLCRFDSLQFSVIKDINTYETMSENLRVLYVAMTRAKEQFITFISVSSKGVEAYVDSVSKKLISSSASSIPVISPFVVKKANTDAELLTLCALIHKDGKVLRDMCSKNDIGFDALADFKLDIEILDENEKPQQQEEQLVLANAELLDELRDKLRFKYDRLKLSAFTSKRTASSLDVAEQDFKYLTSSKPAFLSKANMTSAQKGTAMHTFMQFCDYSESKNNLENEIERLVSMSFLTEEQANSLDRKKLTTLFNGEFAQRMFCSDNIYREIKVSSFVSVNEIEETDYTDEVLIQGIADCVFEENGELVLVDYKTDRVDSEEDLLERYKNQIAFYKKAVAKTLNKPVKEALLYSFSLNKVCIYK
ncbi:helicase-exonuclease AddAB subunit AddA [uncultured Eubacterium sp.]|uniref:helicase-exonuclease AddAB subunit AddA n=1 Tax=uncultured Eubacterium sp. TaxID=165185 RepID=UPI00261233BA|nr:helicase-exonuclease AddAB subunit AddA [uncultured Eubacterium sp.]